MHKISKLRFEELFSAFEKNKVLVIGDVGIDRYTVGEASRISQEAPVPIVSVESSKDKLGLAANVAENLKALGAQAHIASLCGEDRHGKELHELLRLEKIPTEHVFMRKQHKTIVKERIIARGQQVVRVDHELIEQLAKEEEDYFWKNIEPLLETTDAIIIEDYGKSLITHSLARKIIEKANASNTFVAVDPPSTSEEKHIGYYENSSLLTPNIFEAEKLVGFPIRNNSDLKKAGMYLLEKIKANYIVITQGKNGMTLFSSQEAPLHVPTLEQEVFDVSGAGDTAIATLTLAFLAKATPKESIALANWASGLEVRKAGTATVNKEELEIFLKNIDVLY